MKIKYLIILAVVIVFLVALGAYLNRSFIKGEVMRVQAQLQPEVTAQFPNIDATGFNDTQLKLLAQLKAEYQKKPVSFDTNVMKYTAGVKEPWCADFVSWHMKALGQPLVNPNSGGWRIPGVYTLREYYQAEKRWQSAGTYVPKFGDVAIYAHSPAQSHTNFVLSVDTKYKTMVTVGGNEEGRVRIKTKSYLPPHEDLSGFGILK